MNIFTEDSAPRVHFLEHLHLHLYEHLLEHFLEHLNLHLHEHLLEHFHLHIHEHLHEGLNLVAGGVLLLAAAPVADLPLPYHRPWRPGRHPQVLLPLKFKIACFCT